MPARVELQNKYNSSVLDDRDMEQNVIVDDVGRNPISRLWLPNLDTMSDQRADETSKSAWIF